MSAIRKKISLLLNPFLRTRRVRWAFRIFTVYLILAFIASIIAGRDPLMIIQNGHISFPSFSPGPYAKLYSIDGTLKLTRKDNVNWIELPADFKLFHVVTYDPGTSDLVNSNYVSPLAPQYIIGENGNKEKLPWRYRHWLGTTKTGSDVLSALIHGARTSIYVGIGSMLIAVLTGFFLGALAGYYGDYNLKFPRGIIIGIFIMMIPAWFYADRVGNFFHPVSGEFTLAAGLVLFLFKALLFVLVALSPILLRRFPGSFSFLKKEIYIPLDSLISRLIELFLSLPRLVLILTLAAITRPSMFNLILIIGLTSWTDIARLVRIEMMRLKSSGFAEASRALGLKTGRIIFRHLIPNAVGPVSVLVIFGIAGAILSEAGLSFLGIGIPPGTASWGALMFEGRVEFSAWWLVLFPGMAISLLILVLNILGDAWRESLTRRF